MLDDLLHVIETLQQRIRDHGSTLRENETRTRMALIDPLLQALGWDVSDPPAVTPEYNVGNGRADYALLNRDGRPAALIEAKHFSEPLERANHQEQVFTYALMQQVRYAGLTDGDRWILDDVSVFSGNRRILDLSIANTPAHESALLLLLLWRPNLASSQPAVANQPVLNPALATLPVAAVDPAPTAVTEGSRAEPDSGETGSLGWLPFPDFNPPGGSKAPIAIKFPDDVEFAIGSWRQLPKVVADWLYAKQLLTLETLPIVSGRRGFAANDKPAMRNGQPMTTYDTIGHGDIFINVHLSAVSARGNARKMLEHCGINPTDVQVRVV